MLTERELPTVLAALRYWQRTRADCVLYESDYTAASPASDEDATATDEGRIEPLDAAEIDVLCERLNVQEQHPRYVLYDFDAGELATKLIYDSYDAAKDDASQFDNVLIVKLYSEASKPADDVGEDSVRGRSACQPILARLTGITSWEDVPGPQSGRGVDYWFTSADGRKAYLNIDQGYMTVSVDGECIYRGSNSDANAMADASSLVVKCVIACHNTHGEPDLAFVKVRCTRAQYDEGEHYKAAQRWGRQDNYEAPFIVFDENDGPDALFDLFVWDSASVIEA